MEWFDLVSRGIEAEDLRIKVELRVERILDILSLAESVLFALVHLERARQPLLEQGLVHELRLVGRHHLVLVALVVKLTRRIQPRVAKVWGAT